MATLTQEEKDFIDALMSGFADDEDDDEESDDGGE